MVTMSWRNTEQRNGRILGKVSHPRSSRYWSRFSRNVRPLTLSSPSVAYEEENQNRWKNENGKCNENVFQTCRWMEQNTGTKKWMQEDRWASRRKGYPSRHWKDEQKFLSRVFFNISVTGLCLLSLTTTPSEFLYPKNQPTSECGH